MNERLEDILPEPDARLIAGETDAARAEVVAPPGWIVVTRLDGDGSAVLLNAKHMASVHSYRGGNHVTMASEDTWQVREPPSEIAALIARAQAPQPPSGGDDAALLEEMAEALRLADAYWGDPSPLLEDVMAAIKAALARYDARYGQRGAR